ncbi:transposase [Thiocapsa imhoffii]|uniref:transposase n=1 Tax=Thiocapsa imhoffii TaxID=382777 RepID=UPI0035301E32
MSTACCRSSDCSASAPKQQSKQFFNSIPKRLRRTLKVICTVLYAGFIGAAKAFFGKRVLICPDRFHIARLYRDSFET